MECRSYITASRGRYNSFIRHAGKPPSGKPKSQRKLIFSIQEKGNILQGKMLTDEAINLAQYLLAKQFPGISEFMDTCLGKMHQFEIILVDKPYIQLLHAGSMHWVCISNLKTNKCDKRYSLCL